MLETMGLNHEPQFRRRNSHLMLDSDDHLRASDPIAGHAQEPLLSLEDACQPLVGIVNDVLSYAATALTHTPANPPNELTHDESAAIRLFTMEWPKTSQSLYSLLNRALQSPDRKDLQPWQKYLKLLLTAMIKLPCVPRVTIWVGVRKDVTESYPIGSQVTWRGFTSGTTEMLLLDNELYFGTTGQRTMFSIQILNGRYMRDHAHFQNQDEVVILPGTYMKVENRFDPASNLHVLHLAQQIPKTMSLELPFEGALLYPKRRRLCCVLQ